MNKPNPGNLLYSSASSFKLQELIEDCLQKFRLNEQHKEVSLRLIDDIVSPLFIKADRQSFGELLELLLVNAVTVKATKINISLKQLLKTKDEVLLEFTIEDNGIKNLYRIEEFAVDYKLKLEATKKSIEAFGGKTEISTLEGVGTTIKFLIKFFWEAPKELPLKSSHNNLAGKKILVAEDNEINQKIITHLLRKENIEADVANDGKEAVELFEKQHYDLVLLDLQMPNMDGFQTAKYLRKILSSDVPIIAMTAGAFANEQTRCFEIGINQYLNKPFIAEDLFQRLKYLLLNEHYFKSRKKADPVPSKGVFNLNTLKQNNDEEEIIEILEMFINKTPILVKEIKQAIQHEDFNTAIRKIAKLKGSLGSLLMETAMRMVEEMESYIRLGDRHKIPLAIEKLQKEYNTIVPLLKMELKQMRVSV